MKNLLIFHVGRVGSIIFSWRKYGENVEILCAIHNYGENVENLWSFDGDFMCI